MAPKFALFTEGSKLPLNKGFKNMFELLQFCTQPSKGISAIEIGLYTIYPTVIKCGIHLLSNRDSNTVVTFYDHDLQFIFQSLCHSLEIIVFSLCLKLVLK